MSLFSRDTQQKLICRQSLVTIASCFIWFLVFFAQAHKEERFLFPAYPLICLLAAMSFVLLRNFIIFHTPVLHRFVLASIKLVFLTFTLISVSRVLALYKGKSLAFQIKYIEKVSLF